MKDQISREDWISICRGWEDSGISQREYSLEHGIEVGTLKYHLSELRKAGVLGSKKGFSQVKIIGEKSSQARPYCQIEFEGFGRILIESESGLMMLKQLLSSGV